MILLSDDTPSTTLTADETLDLMATEETETLLWAYRGAKVAYEIDKRNALYRERWERRLREHNREARDGNA